MLLNMPSQRGAHDVPARLWSKQGRMGIYASSVIGCFVSCQFLSRLLKQFLAGPVLVAVPRVLIKVSRGRLSNHYLLAIGHVSPHDQRDLFLPHLLNRNLKGVGLALKINKYRRIHAIPR